MSDQSTQPVEYREVNGFPGYRVGDDGSVWTQKSKGRSKKLGEWRTMKLGKDTSGYLMANLSHEGKSKTILVHHVVLRAFGFEKPTPKHETRHLDGVKTNNRLGNLKWGTSKENNDDQRKHGTLCLGERHRSARLTELDIKKIRNDYPELDNGEVAAIFGVDRSHICKIRKRRKWKHVL